VSPANSSLRFIPLRPTQSVPLVLVWNENQDAPPVQRFRELISEWHAGGKLWI
jgi:DNA-binding transcriptional LysR family regulator